MQEKVFGCSAFGLSDTLSDTNFTHARQNFFLSEALLPSHSMGKILCGAEAKKHRTHTGLFWPPDGQIKRGEPIRRVPISYAWRAMVEAEDRTIRWKTDFGMSVPLGRILADHLTHLLGSANIGNTDASVFVIPNRLDEYGQTVLLNELNKSLNNRPNNKRQIHLIWRPIAAALSWLEQVGGDFIPKNMQDDDHIHILYFGPDALEFATLRLRTTPDSSGIKYVIPLRDRPRGRLPFFGMDWAGCIIEEAFDKPAPGDFLQALTAFDDVWSAMAGQMPASLDYPKIWCYDEKWSYWNPPPDLPKRSFRVSTDHCETLRRLFKESCPLIKEEKYGSCDLDHFLRLEFQQLVEKNPADRLRGIILCGPLAPKQTPDWLQEEISKLTNSRLNVSNDPLTPQIDCLWLCPGETALAHGAAIYGERVEKELPTYLDTLPQLSILAQLKGRYKWVQLLKANEIEGGKTHRESITKQFQLGQGGYLLDVFLRKGELVTPDAYDSDDDSPDPGFFGLKDCQARLLREAVRNMGSLDRALNKLKRNRESAEVQYSKAFARFFFGDVADKQNADLDPEGITKEDAPFRKARFNFPSAPDREMLLDLEVRMKPASGLAQLEILPEDASFLRGRRVYLDYSTMRPEKKLPKIQRGWPMVREMPVAANDFILNSNKWTIFQFEKASPLSSQYLSRVGDVKNCLLMRTESDVRFGIEIKTRAIDQSGVACTEKGQEYVRRIAHKFEQDFYKISDRNLLNKLFVRATWLWGATPKPIVDYVLHTIENTKNGQIWLSALEAASRCVTLENDFKFVYKSITDRYLMNAGGQRFPVQTPRSLCRMLMFRRDACMALDREKATLFAKGAIDRIKEEHGNRKYKEIFFRCILMMLFLLRIRRHDPGAFDPDDSKDTKPFFEVQTIMEAAAKYTAKSGDRNMSNKIEEIMVGIQTFLEYKGDESIISIVRNLSGED